MTPGLHAITRDDVAHVAHLHAASWRATYRGMLRDEFLDGDLISDREALWRTRIASMTESDIGVIARVDGQPVGFVYAFGNADPRWGAQLDNLHVLPQWHGRGIGRALLVELCRLAEHRLPGQGLYLWVFEKNAAARAFYERFGASSGERAVIEAPGGGSIAEWRYWWPSPQILLAHTR